MALCLSECLPRTTCTLEIVPGCVFNVGDPMILGCRVVEGSCRVGMQLRAGRIFLGRVTRMELNHVPIHESFERDKICIRIEGMHQPWVDFELIHGI